MNRTSRFFARSLTAAKARPLFLVGFFFAVLVPFILFGELAEEILEGNGLPFDEPILRWLHASATPARDRWMVAITQLGGPVPMVIGEALVVSVLLTIQRWRRRRSSLDAPSSFSQGS